MIWKIFCVILSVIILINGQSQEEDEEVKICTTKDGTVGECVPYYLCKNGKIITDGEDLIDTRFEGECQEYFEECCETENQQTKEESLTVKRNETFIQECGIRNKNGLLFSELSNPIHGESQYGEFPWMAAILIKETLSESFVKSYKCGGSLIAQNIILTAAHCVKKINPTDIIVRLGEWDTESDYEIFKHSDHEVDKIISHEKFYAAGVHNDIALLFLKTDAKLTETVNTICLPTQDQPIDMTRCIATGWGKTKFEKEEGEKPQRSLPRILKSIELPTVQHDDCQSKLRKTKLGRRFKLHESFMCAGGEEGVDTCQGDGGSPLVCPIPGTQDKYYQTGIVAWGIGCGDKDIPGVYVNVAKFTSWINEQIAFNAFD